VPAQVPLLVLAAVFFWLLVHRTPIGRGVRAIGFSPEGARFAGIPVARRLLLVYVLSGAMAGLAAVVYAARLGRPRPTPAAGTSCSRSPRSSSGARRSSEAAAACTERCSA
jgi:rhamnose transport system permease protein